MMNPVGANAANVAVQRRAKVWRACGLGMPRKAGGKRRWRLMAKWLEALSDSVTAREAHLCGERGSPAAGKGMACLRVGYAPQGGGKHAQGVFVG